MSYCSLMQPRFSAQFGGEEARGSAWLAACASLALMRLRASFGHAWNCSTQFSWPISRVSGRSFCSRISHGHTGHSHIYHHQSPKKFLGRLFVAGLLSSIGVEWNEKDSCASFGRCLSIATIVTPCMFLAVCVHKNAAYM